nr:MAG TPA: hypothetical protein [Caudoviricetes sp.]
MRSLNPQEFIRRIIMTWIDAGMHLSLAAAAVASILSMMML